MLKMKYSKLELTELAKAWAVLSLAFGIVLNSGVSNLVGLVQTIVISAVAVGSGFLLHELAHKYVAQKYQLWAEFRAYDQGLLFALIMSFFGFIFAAPGAVYIHGPFITRKQNGLISAAGPAMNYVLAVVFLVLTIFTTGFLQTIMSYGFLINTWLGLFNMIPFLMFDGAKIWKWNKWVWGAQVVTGLVLLNLRSII